MRAHNIKPLFKGFLHENELQQNMKRNASCVNVAGQSSTSKTAKTSTEDSAAKEEVGLQVPITKPGITIFGESPVTGKHFAIPNETISQVSCGSDHCILVCESGRVFAFGSNTDGQCGLGRETDAVIQSPTLVESLVPHKVVQAACRPRTSFFLTADGDLSVCGYHAYGQLGLGHNRSCPFPVFLFPLQKARTVSVSREHFAVITASDEVLVDFFAEVKLPKNIVKVACIDTYVVALTSSGEVFWGKKRLYAVFGLPDTIVDVACGNEHVLALTAAGSVWAFGSNKLGQIGSEDNPDLMEPVECRVPCGVPVWSIFAGRNGSGLVTEDGDVWLWGTGALHALGRTEGRVSKPTIVTKGSNLKVDHVAFSVTFTVIHLRETSETMRGLPSTESILSKLETSLKSALECPVCLQLMCGYIFMCVKGHSLCSACRRRTPSCPLCRASLTNTRNFALERQCAECRLSCAWCSLCMSVSALEYHVHVCKARLRVCPLPGCTWIGVTCDVRDHVVGVHQELTWNGSPHAFSFCDASGRKETRPWFVDGRLFVFSWKYENGEVYASAKLIDDHTQPSKHKLRLRFFGKEKNITTHTSGTTVDSDNVELQDSPCYKMEARDAVICEAAILDRKSCDDEVDAIAASVT